MKNPNGYGGIVKLKGNRRKPFQVRITKGWEVKDGKQRQIVQTLGYYVSRKEAMLALAQYNASPYDLNNKNMTFSQVFEKWSDRHFEKYPKSKGGLISAYKKCEPLYKVKMTEIKKEHMQNILDAYKHQSEQSQTKLKTIFLNSFKYALENDIVTKDYSQFLTINAPKVKTKKEKYFNDAELKLIFKNLNFEVDYPVGKKSYKKLCLTDTVTILLYTGLRITELLELKIKDVNIKERYMLVHGTKTDDSDRIIPIHKDIISTIEKLIKTNVTYLIEIEPDTPIKNGVQYRKYFFEPFMNYLELSHTPHACRHTFATVMDRNGVTADSVVLKRIMGHANSSTTEIYTHKNIDDLIQAIDKFKL